MGKRVDKKFNENGIELNLTILDSILKFENLNAELTYNPLSLNFNGKPIFSIGQKLSKIDSTLSYRIDPNMDYQDYFPIIIDYMTTEDKLSVYQIGKHSYINGILYFSVEQETKKIFNVSGSWGFEINDNGEIEQAELWLTESLFPKLKGKFEFKDKWNYKIENQYQTELFELKKKEDSWILNYKVELK